jgi:nucleoside-diphosphate-sugar epimerase
MMEKVAILGANGFIGSRLTEVLHLGGQYEPVPIIRSVLGMPAISRFGIQYQMADAFNQAALTRAMRGCRFAVYCALSSHPKMRQTILGTVKPFYRAASDAGIDRIIYLSTASVHGQAPSQGTNESSPLHTRHPFAYNNYKVLAERRLRRLCEGGIPEVLFLRPAIVFGPRSYWVRKTSMDILAGQAYLVDGGHGICNTIYVDNLVHAIKLGFSCKDANGEAFLVGDDEQVTWRAFYEVLAVALGANVDSILEVRDLKFPPAWWSRLLAYVRDIENDRYRGYTLRLMRLVERHLFPTGWETSRPADKGLALAFPPSADHVTEDMASLHRCPYKLPHDKARRLLGYMPPVSFEEGIRRSIGWLEFLGYPVVDRHGRF